MAKTIGNPIDYAEVDVTTDADNVEHISVDVIFKSTTKDIPLSVVIWSSRNPEKRKWAIGMANWLCRKINAANDLPIVVMEVR